MKEKIMKFLNRDTNRKTGGGYYEPGPVDQNSKANNEPERKNDNESQALAKAALDKFSTRRSIRKFSMEEIPWETTYKIIEAATNAPCAGNVQNYHVIAIRDKKIRHELGKLAFQQYWLSDAPTILVVVREDHHIQEMYPQEGATYSIQNSAAFIMSLIELAHFHDLGACWVEAFDNGALKDFLGIPMDRTVDAIIPMGYAMETPKVSKVPVPFRIYYDKWGKRRK